MFGRRKPIPFHPSYARRASIKEPDRNGSDDPWPGSQRWPLSDRSSRRTLQTACVGWADLDRGNMGQPRSHRFINVPGLFTDEQVEGWRAVTEAVHAEGGTIFAQLAHSGAVSHPDFFEGTPPLAPSAVNPGLRAFTQEGFKETVTPRAMTIADIKRTIGDYATAAQNARAAGFDGVEIHAGTTCLLPEFLNSALNVRGYLRR